MLPRWRDTVMTGIVNLLSILKRTRDPELEAAPTLSGCHESCSFAKEPLNNQ